MALSTTTEQQDGGAGTISIKLGGMFSIASSHNDCPIAAFVLTPSVRDDGVPFSEQTSITTVKKKLELLEVAWSLYES
jgi:hypothetical protein